MPPAPFRTLSRHGKRNRAARWPPLNWAQRWHLRPDCLKPNSSSSGRWSSIQNSPTRAITWQARKPRIASGNRGSRFQAGARGTARKTRKRGSIWARCCSPGETNSLNAGNHEQAVLRYREALAYRPADAELHTNLGVALAQLGRLNEAQPELEAALRIDPNLQPAKKALAAVQAQMNKM